MPVHTQIIIPATSPLINYQGKPCQPRTGLIGLFVSCDGGTSVTLLQNWTDASFAALCQTLTGLTSHPTQCSPASTFLDGVATPLISSQLSPQKFSIYEAPPVNATTPGLHNWTIISSHPNHFHFFSLTSTVTSLENTTIQHDAPAFEYNPPAAWTNIDTTEHSTTQANANVTFTFKGDRVALYGAVVQGRYTAQVDGGQTFNFADHFNLNQQIPGELLFYTDGLGNGNHSVVVSASSGVFSLSSAIVDGTSNPPAVVGGMSNPQTSSSSSPSASTTSSPATSSPHLESHHDNSHHAGLSKAQLIGIVAGVVVLITLLVLALAYTFWRRKVRRRTEARSATPLPWQPSAHLAAIPGIAQPEIVARMPTPQIENLHHHTQGNSKFRNLSPDPISFPQDVDQARPPSYAS